MPKVSMIMPVYNGEKTIAKAIESALAQTEKDIEVVVADDCSTDNTVDVVKAIAARDARVKLVALEKNGKAPNASNQAINAATGEWVAVLDADDWFEPNRIEVMLNAAARYNADFVIDNLRIYDHVLKQVIEDTQYGAKDQVTELTAETFFRRDNPLRRHAMGYSKPMVKKKFLADHNIEYRVSHHFGYDFIFTTENLLEGAKAIIVPQALYVYVHRISPTTRQQAPTSRSLSGHTMIVRGCNELLEKYAGVLTPSQRAALTQRRDIFQDRLYCQDMINAIRDGEMFDASVILLRHPFILVLIATTLAKQYYARGLGMVIKWRNNRNSHAYAN